MENEGPDRISVGGDDEGLTSFVFCMALIALDAYKTELNVALAAAEDPRQRFLASFREEVRAKALPRFMAMLAEREQS